MDQEDAMDKISRRKALKYLLAGGAAAAAVPILDACQRALTPTTAETAVPATESPLETGAANEAPSIYPDMAVARNAEPEALVRAAIEAIGGLARFVPSGGWVIIKPNICTDYYGYEYAATTNPWVVGTLVKLCFEAGAGKVQVMDYPFGGSPESAYQTSGIAEQVNANGGEMVVMSSFKFKDTKIENSLGLDSITIYEDVFKADTLINVPIAKNHGMSRLTLGMKNLMGLMEYREQVHWNFGKCLTDLTKTIAPELTVIDAVRILLNNGPTGGDLNDVKKLDTVIVSPDIVAADSYGATLFSMQPEDLDFVRYGAKNGLGRSDLSALNIQEIDLAA
jgi:uncharacterized protein (DUF362 family)